MKPSFSKFLMTALKSVPVLFLAVFLSFFLLAWKTKNLADDLWKQLGITQTDANINIYTSVQNGSIAYAAKNAKNIVSGDRIAIINQLVVHAKKYVASDEFVRRYERERKIRKPAEPELIPVSVENVRASEKERIEKAIKQAEANANSPNEKLRNSVPQTLERLRTELKDVDDPDNKKVQAKLNQTQAMNNAILTQYKNDLQKLETNLPENPQDLIKKRLQQILDITAEVDFDAELKEVGRFKVFVNPVYEKKSKDWKLAFRAGRETTEAVRAIAKKWLEEVK